MALDKVAALPAVLASDSHCGAETYSTSVPRRRRRAGVNLRTTSCRAPGGGSLPMTLAVHANPEGASDRAVVPSRAVPDRDSL